MRFTPLNEILNEPVAFMPLSEILALECEPDSQLGRMRETVLYMVHELQEKFVNGKEDLAAGRAIVILRTINP